MSPRSRYFYAVRRRRKLACALLALVIALEEEELSHARRSSWVTPYLARRDERGMHHNLFLELALEDPNRFRRCLRMDTDSFEYLLGKVTPLIQKADTHLRRSIPPDERLSLTLRHIATGSYNLLSRARRCSENAFGVLGARFQIYRAAMRYDPDDAVTIIMATICLHNWLRSQAVGRAMYTPSPFIDFEDELAGEVIEGEWRAETANGIVNFCGQGGNRHANDALQLREMWCEYFNGVGAVPWQDRMVR
ncbi:Major inner capsid protein VP2 [Frankliniella fusca]|uniref:Major inner capsid protein VP2 n=1 Tax=Frankliniella fusca TaxID=407009 RepID=A0AAE1GZE0_9NEOP|nr:Major inner capsid protein VP2 [Frankliniella fusca]KAK3915395.1 Major inner capsid protein VP2 [Frankliniella fusca]KAK3922209.1 Major inner capsid protein VP2 [Frankliniella fusca]